MDSALFLEVLPSPLWGPTIKLSLSMEKKVQKNSQAGIWWPSQNPTPLSPQVPDPEYSDNCSLKPHLQEVTVIITGVLVCFALVIFQLFNSFSHWKNPLANIKARPVSTPMFSLLGFSYNFICRLVIMRTPLLLIFLKNIYNFETL